MATKKKSTKKKEDLAPSMNMEGTPPELIIVTKPEAGLRAATAELFSVTGENVKSLSSLLDSSKAKLIPVFGNEERVAMSMASASVALEETVPNLTTFYKVETKAETSEDNLEKIAEKLRNENLVEAAYVQPQAYAPTVMEEAAPATEEAPPVTPDFTSRQIYLNAAPAGIDARFAWTRSGGKGQGVKIIDIEGAWRFDHEDLMQNQGGVIGGTQSTDIGWRNHGTAVTGEFGGDENSFGMTGICPQANVRAISIFGSGQSTAKAITDAANALSPGDIILIELHAPGPHFNFQDIGGQRGFIAMEFWPANFAAIVYATTVRKVIVIEAGGNGAENFDDPLYNVRPQGFPTSWTNPFNLANPQSGAIIVGAGAPPPGTHGRDHGPDRSRLDFSNYGSRVDVQGWGREVTTTGYGDLQGGSNENFWYTDVFSGTSSASPIIVGAVGCMQGGLRAAGKPLLTAATARNILRATGSPQQDAPGRPATQRIGNRPNLKQAFSNLGIGKTTSKEIIKEKEIVKDLKDVRKEIKEKEIVKDLKDGRKEIKEKEFKENIKEVKDIRETDKIREVINPSPTGTGGIEDRLSQLEENVSQLTHFIGESLRPDLQSSALSQEEDLMELSRQLEKEVVDSKEAKDNKDVEKVREV